MKVKITSMSFVSYLSFGGCCRLLIWVWYLEFICLWSLVYDRSIVQLLLQVQRVSMSFKSWLDLWRVLEICKLFLESYPLFGYRLQVFDITFSEFSVPLYALGLDWGFQGHWQFLTRFGIMVLIWIWPVVFDTTLFGIFTVQTQEPGLRQKHIENKWMQ